MRKIAAFLSGLIPSAVYALYVGNPSAPQFVETGLWLPPDSFYTFKVGFQTDYIFDRQMQVNDHVKMHEYTAHIDQAVVTLNLLDRTELYASIGVITPHFSFVSSQGYQTFHFHDQWTMGGGGKAILFQWGNTSIGIDAKFQYAKPQVYGVVSQNQFVTSQARFKHTEWHVAFACSHTIDWITPYVGVKYSEGTIHPHKSALELMPPPSCKMGSQDHIGLVIGCALSPGKKFDLNFEARVFDEQSLSVYGSLKF